MLAFIVYNVTFFLEAREMFLLSVALSLIIKDSRLCQLCWFLFVFGAPLFLWVECASLFVLNQNKVPSTFRGRHLNVNA